MDTPRLDTTLLLPVPRSRWAPPAGPVTLDGVELHPKEELHVTLIGSMLGSELRRSLAPARLDREIAALLDRLDWSFTRTGRCLLLRKASLGEGHRRVAHSVIECIDMPAMADFHQALGKLLGRQLPIPPAHVTLYVAGRARGIGVPDPRRLRALAVRVLAPGELPPG